MKDNPEEVLLQRAAGAIRKLIGFVFVALAAGVLGGLAVGKAIWKEEKVPPHGSLINTNHEVLLPSTQHLISRLAKIDRDLDRMLAWTSNANAAIRGLTAAVEWPTWTNYNKSVAWTNAIDKHLNYFIPIPVSRP